MPDAAWAVNGRPPGSSQDEEATLVSTSSFRLSTRQRQRTYVHRSSSRPIPDAIEPRLFPRRSAQRSSANAPVGGLKPPPEGRLRRAIQPPSLLQHRSQWDHHLPIRPASCVRVHNISMPVYPGALHVQTDPTDTVRHRHSSRRLWAPRRGRNPQREDLPRSLRGECRSLRHTEGRSSIVSIAMVTAVMESSP